MSFSDIIKPRKDVLSGDGVEGIVDLENLRDAAGKRIEARPRDFLDLTFPTSDVRYVLENLHQRFNDNKRSAGLYLFEGYKGSGKSHLLLLIHHLAKNPVLAREWLTRYNLQCDLPDEILVIVHKFTDFPLYAIWDLIINPNGTSGSSGHERPNLDQLRAAIKGKHIFLILDELEMGIRSISDKSVQDQNIAFLQMLTEESGRSEANNITLFASIYDATQEPGATLKRVPRIDVKFADANDRAKVVLHRLFENTDSIDRKKVAAVVASFSNCWKSKIRMPDGYIDALIATYPFSPELLHLIQEKSRMFQGTRGALGLLGAIVKQTYRKADLITAAHATIQERSIKNRLIDLDPGMALMNCAQSDFKDLGDNKFAEEIVSCVLLATLTASGKVRGMSEDTIALQVLKPGDDINEFKGTIRAFHKLGTYFHETEGVFFFDPEEKPNAKVEYRSLNVDPKKALAKAFDFWTGELFGDRDAIVFQTLEQAQAELRMRDSKRLRYVLTPRRLTPGERHDLYHGHQNRNLIVLLEPRNKDFDALKNDDIRKWSQRFIAADELQQSPGSAERKRQFDKIAKDDKSFIVDAFRKAGLGFTWIQKYGSKAEEDQVEFEQLGNSATREEVVTKLSQQFFPSQYFEEHLRENMTDFMGKRLKDVERIYRETLGYPVMTHTPRVREALCNLCAQKEIGLRHEKDSACGRKPALTEGEWPDVIIAEPFEDKKLPSEFGFGGYVQTLTPPTTIEKDERNDTNKTTGSGIVNDENTPVPVETPFARGAGALRQEVAVILSQFDECRVKEIICRIYCERKNVDFGTLPAGLRGSLSGLGSITADLTISRSGDFSKSEAEQIVEGLPSFPEGDYKAEMKVMPQARD